MALTSAQKQRRYRERRNEIVKRAASIEPMLEFLKTQNLKLETAIRELKRENRELIGALERAAVPHPRE